MDPETVPQTRPARSASHAEIIQAMEALTDEDSERLEQVAINRLTRVGRKAANGRTHEDLLQEAMARTLEGQRHWYPEKVKFVPYLIGVIWSISSEWAGHRKRNPTSPDYAALESQLTSEDGEGNTLSPFDDVKARDPNVEDQVVEAETLAERHRLVDAIQQYFAQDEDGTSVLLGWQEGMDGPAIQKEFGFSDTKYRTIVRRLKRNSVKIMKEAL